MEEEVKIVNLLSIVVIFLSAPTLALGQTKSQENVIENIAALWVAEKHCGVKINQNMLAIAINSVGLSPEQIAPSGRYGNITDNRVNRALVLVQKPSGKASFCKNIRSDLSAMID
jgi:hypothetical protein